METEIRRKEINIQIPLRTLEISQSIVFFSCCCARRQSMISNLCEIIKRTKFIINSYFAAATNQRKKWDFSSGFFSSSLINLSLKTKRKTIKIPIHIPQIISDIRACFCFASSHSSLVAIRMNSIDYKYRLNYWNSWLSSIVKLLFLLFRRVIIGWSKTFHLMKRSCAKRLAQKTHPSINRKQ